MRCGRGSTSRSDRSSSSWAIVVTMIFLSLAVLRTATAYPMQYRLPAGGVHCLYDRLEENEYLTMALFVGDGDRLEAQATMEGPVADHGRLLARELGEDLSHFDKRHDGKFVRRDVDPDELARQRRRQDGVKTEYESVNRNGVLLFSELVSFEEDEEQQDYYVDDDQPFDGDDDLKRENIEAMRESLRDQNRHLRDRERGRMDGDPFEKTVKIYAAGWYRVCATAKHKIIVELEMRKSSELGEPDDYTGHVPSELTHIEVEEELELDADAAQEEDLERSKEYLKHLHQVLSVIKESQNSEVRRIHRDKELNAHHHSGMVLGSLFETVLFICVTGFQVHTIRKWFSGDPTLGR